MFLSPLEARTKSDPSLFGSRRFHPERINSLRRLIDADALTPRMQSRWNVVVARPETYSLRGPLDPWSFDGHYDDIAGSNAKHDLVRDDLRACVDYALRYALYGAETDAENASMIIDAYAGIVSFVDREDGPLAWSRYWPLLVQAAMLIDAWSPFAPVRDRFIATTIRAYNAFEKTAYTRDQNWAAVACCNEIAISGYLGDRTWFMRALNQWRVQFNAQIRSGIEIQGQVRYNIAVHEIYREGASTGNGSHGLPYSSMTLNGFAMGAEWARLNGEWLFDHVSPEGSSLRGFYEQVAYWIHYPTPENLWFNTSKDDPDSPYYNTGYGHLDRDPWVDVLNALWPNEDAQFILDRDIPARDDRHWEYMRMGELLYRLRPLYG